MDDCTNEVYFLSVLAYPSGALTFNKLTLRFFLSGFLSFDLLKYLSLTERCDYFVLSQILSFMII